MSADRTATAPTPVRTPGHASGLAPRRAMLLAAGLGTRMRPLSAAVPKPLLPLGGRPLLDHALNRLAAAGVTRVVVNAHWLADRVEAHLLARRGPPDTVLRREDELLDTGGAVAAALAAGALADAEDAGAEDAEDAEDAGAAGTAPFFVVNGDSYWLDGPTPALARLAAAFDAEVDGVLLVHRTFQVHSDVGSGDFHMDELGRLRRREEQEIVPYVYAGVQLVSPRLFAGAPPGRFSMNALWDRALEAGRLRAVVHDGLWFHLSRPEDLSEAEQALFAQETGETT